MAGFLSYQSAADAILFQTQEQLGNVAEKTAQQVDNFFQVSRKEIELLSDFPFIQLAFLQFEFNQRLDTVKRLLEDYALKSNHFNNIYLIDLTGKPILSLKPSNMQPGFSFSHFLWFQNTLKTGIYLSDLDMTQNTSPRNIFLGKVVFDYEDPTRVVGVLAFDIERSSFTQYVAGVRIGNQGFGFLLHQNGQLIYHPKKSLIMRDTRFMGDDRMQQHTKRMQAGEKGYGHYTFQKQEKYMVYRPCREQLWSVGISVFESELMADIYKFRRQMISFFLILICLILPVSYFFIKSITNPIQSLIKGAAAVSNGNLDHVITIKSNDELKAVSNEFNKMAATLKNTMEEILDLKTFNEDILRNVTGGIITVDRTGNITSLNKSAQKILNYAPESVLINKSTSLPTPVRQILDLLTQTLDTGSGSLGYELKLSDNHRETTYIEINTSLLSNELGKTFGAIADMRDITRRKRMEEIMVRVDKLASLGELSAGIAHEIRNPLAGIKTSVQVLTNRMKDESEKELIDGILSEIERLNSIVTDLLLFSRPSSPIIEPVDITSIMDRTVDLMSEKIRKSQITLKKHYTKELTLIMADREQVKQVLLNLLLNAIKAVKNSGEISLTTRLETDQAVLKEKLSRFNKSDADGRSAFVEVIIKDTGIGIKKDDMAKIFNPFFTTYPSGTGLGLSIVHQLVEKNGGYIFIDSQENIGTQVTLLMPVTQNKVRE